MDGGRRAPRRHARRQAAGLSIPATPLLLVGLGILAYNAAFHLAPPRLPGDPMRLLAGR